MRREKVRKVYRLVLPDKRCIMPHIISIPEKDTFSTGKEGEGFYFFKTPSGATLLRRHFSIFTREYIFHFFIHSNISQRPGLLLHIRAGNIFCGRMESRIRARVMFYFLFLFFSLVCRKSFINARRSREDVLINCGNRVRHENVEELRHRS